MRYGVSQTRTRRRNHQKSKGGREPTVGSLDNVVQHSTRGVAHLVGQDSAALVRQRMSRVAKDTIMAVQGEKR